MGSGGGGGVAGYLANWAVLGRVGLKPAGISGTFLVPHDFTQPPSGCLVWSRSCLIISSASFFFGVLFCSLCMCVCMCVCMRPPVCSNHSAQDFFCLVLCVRACVCAHLISAASITSCVVNLQTAAACKPSAAGRLGNYSSRTRFNLGHS